MKEVHHIHASRLRPRRRAHNLAREGEIAHGRVLAVPAKEPYESKPDSEGAHVLHGFHDLYDAAPIGFYALDRQGRISELNERGANLLGFSADWLLGKPFIVFIAGLHVRRFLDFLREPIVQPQPRVIELDLDVSNRTLPIQISLTTAGEGRSLRHRITVVDFTDVRKTENLLQESLANWHSLVQNAPDTIMTVEQRGRISFVNKPLWGYATDVLIGTNILDYIDIAEQSKVLRCLEQTFQYNKRTLCEVAGDHDGRTMWFSFSFGSPHANGQSDLGPTTTLMIREISDTKRKEAILRTSGEQLRQFAARLEAVREEERTRVAREIHDELGQALTALRLDLSWVQGKTRGASTIRKRMKEMIAHVDDTIELVRRISSELRPAILDDLGLIPAMEWQVSQFRKRTRIRTDIISNTEGLQLSMQASVAVFRVVQEALTNVMRHANATRVRIHVDLLGKVLRISVVDNGRGMTPNLGTDLKSLGIVGMKERISRLGGEFKILSEPGKGTRLDIIIPTEHD